jgi:hypothetical protein
MGALGGWPSAVPVPAPEQLDERGFAIRAILAAPFLTDIEECLQVRSTDQSSWTHYYATGAALSANPPNPPPGTRPFVVIVTSSTVTIAITNTNNTNTIITINTQRHQTNTTKHFRRRHHRRRHQPLVGLNF